jgi:hypothetical protein
VNQGPVGVQDVGVFPFRLGAVVSVDDVVVENAGQENHGVDDHWITIFIF